MGKVKTKMTAREFISPILYDRLDSTLQHKVDYWYLIYTTPKPPWYKPISLYWWKKYWKVSVPLLLHMREEMINISLIKLKNDIS